ncbi:MAG TPA: hypothetical protein VEL07_21160 [Planctomycetota bacterium]|nr:hypothetical protein [Planctomycetota bacterium]
MPRWIGLDIGERSVRAIAIVPGKGSAGGWRIAGHASANRRDASGEERPLAVALSEIDAALRLKGARLSVASRDHTTLIRFVATAPMPRDRLDKLLRLELSQHVEGGGELAADTFVVPVGGDEIIHCCVLAQPPQVRDLVATLAQVGATPTRIHHVGAAAMNATLPAPPVADDDLALVVDLDALSAQVVLVGDRRPLACRQVGIGYVAFSEALARARGDRMRSETGMIRKREAEARAREDELVLEDPHAAEAPAFEDEPEPRIELEDADPAVPSAASPGPSSDLFIDEAPAAPAGTGTEYVIDFDRNEPSPAAGAATVATPEDEIGPRADDDRIEHFGPELMRLGDQLYGQLASSLAWFRAQLRTQARLDPVKILLTGVGAGVPGLAVYLQSRFNKPVEVYDPTAALTGDVPPDGHGWFGALGLALSEAEGAVALDLMPDDLVMRREWRDRLVWPFAAAGLTLITCGLVGWTWLHQDGVQAESLAAYQAYFAQHDKLKGELDRLHGEKEALSDDLRAIASRIHAGRDLLYTVRALKEQAGGDTGGHKELWVVRLETVGVGKDPQAPATQREPAAQRARNAGGKKAPSVVDTTIDRGAVNISGQVKFDDAKDKTVLKKFLDDYIEAVEDWTFPAQEGGAEVRIALFDAAKTWVLGTDIEHDDEAPANARPGAKARDAKGGKKGEFNYHVQFVFQPTKLSLLTERADVAEAAPATDAAPAAEPAPAPDAATDADATATPAVEGEP